MERTTWQELWSLVEGYRQTMMNLHRERELMNNLTFFFLLIICRCLLLVKANPKPEGKGTCWCSPYRSASQGTKQGGEGWRRSGGASGKCPKPLDTFVTTWIPHFLQIFSKRSDPSQWGFLWPPFLNFNPQQPTPYILTCYDFFFHST